MTVGYLDPPYQCNYKEKSPNGEFNISYIVKRYSALYGQHSSTCSKMAKVQRPSGKILQSYIRHKTLFTDCWFTNSASLRNITCETHFTSCSTHKSCDLFVSKKVRHNNVTTEMNWNENFPYLFRPVTMTEQLNSVRRALMINSQFIS
jgi:hypothetical protein